VTRDRTGRRHTPKGEAKPVLGRKFCTACGRWRLLIDFHSSQRTKSGTTIVWQSECCTCTRLRRRKARGQNPQKWGRIDPKVQRQRTKERMHADPERLARQREYWRIYKEAKRREAGIPPRKTKKPRPALTQGLDLVSNESLRERFLELEEREGLTAADVARRLDWMISSTEKGEVPDDRRVRRLLGLEPWISMKGGRKRSELSKRMRYENAVSLLRALDLDPVDIGV
jgi:hypothetical protein